MIAPGPTLSPSYFLTPNLLDAESLPNLVEPLALVCAIIVEIFKLVIAAKKISLQL